MKWNWRTLVKDLVSTLLGWTTKNVQAEVDELAEKGQADEEESDG